MIQIAIADDEALFRRGMRMILEDYPDLRVILEADSGETLLQQVRACVDPPDVLLLDLKMPGMGGIEAAEVLHREFPSIAIVVVSSHVSKTFIINMIEIGAAAYLGKNAHPDEVIETIRAVREKGFFYSPMVLQTIRERMMGGSTDRPDASRSLISPPTLTQREREVLQLICAECTTHEIGEKLYISARTVEGHRNNLLSKFGCRNVAGLVVYAMQHGLV
jgi:DNA-binding NarL/FixJ family response regulator